MGNQKAILIHGDNADADNDDQQADHIPNDIDHENNELLDAIAKLREEESDKQRKKLIALEKSNGTLTKHITILSIFVIFCSGCVIFDRFGGLYCLLNDVLANVASVIAFVLLCYAIFIHHKVIQFKYY